MAATILTRDDIQALRKATSVAFHHHDGRSYLRVYLRTSGDPAIYTASEQRVYPGTDGGITGERHRDIDTEGSMSGFTGEGFASWNLETNPKASAFYLTHHMKSEHETIFNLLRAGDTLWLTWLGSNNNDNVRGIRWHRDELRLCIARGDNTMVFLIQAETGPDNSARMVRRHGR